MSAISSEWVPRMLFRSNLGYLNVLPLTCVQRCESPLAGHGVAFFMLRPAKGELGCGACVLGFYCVPGTVFAITVQSETQSLRERLNMATEETDQLTLENKTLKGEISLARAEAAVSFPSFWGLFDAAFFGGTIKFFFPDYIINLHNSCGHC